MPAKDVSTGHAIDTLYLEERRYEPDPGFARQANAKPDLYKRGFDDFWREEGERRVTWFKPFDDLYEWSPPYAKWFIGGRLNICYNCVDRHVEQGQGDKVAYFWEGEPEGERERITFAQLQKQIVKFANGLKKLGVKKARL